MKLLSQQIFYNTRYFFWQKWLYICWILNNPNFSVVCFSEQQLWKSQLPNVHAAESALCVIVNLYWFFFYIMMTFFSLISILQKIQEKLVNSTFLIEKHF
eukprot:TRINITY_DN11496_c1_g1_i1.p2 TRINITY_DN11496_c1_g1~~TRINITY_DN11496_c1_g1_i1.p2  ORF type:complete len:100 (-),score=3.05 TRINITY_DN11496_c1_g1_i1:245-544(-)